jgi:hypothetical protein
LTVIEASRPQKASVFNSNLEAKVIGSQKHWNALLIMTLNMRLQAMELLRRGVSQFLIKPKLLSLNVRGLNEAGLGLILCIFKKLSWRLCLVVLCVVCGAVMWIGVAWILEGL